MTMVVPDRAVMHRTKVVTSAASASIAEPEPYRAYGSAPLNRDGDPGPTQPSGTPHLIPRSLPTFGNESPRCLYSTTLSGGSRRGHHGNEPGHLHFAPLCRASDASVPPPGICR